jgi:hypothetical protein
MKELRRLHRKQTALVESISPDEQVAKTAAKMFFILGIVKRHTEILGEMGKLMGAE